MMLLLSVLALLVLPRFAGSMDRAALESQVRAMIALSRKARSLAISEGRVYLLVVDPETAEMRLARRRDPLAAPQSEDDPELEIPETPTRWSNPIEFSEDVSLDSCEVNGEEVPADALVEVAFDSGGHADDARLVFVGPDGEESITVTIDPVLAVARIEPDEDDS